MSAHSGPNLVEDGLVLYLDAANPQSYSGTGTTWYDLSGNANHGSLINDVLFSTDNMGSFVFDGTNDYVLIPASESTNIRNSVSVGMFAKSNYSGSGWSNYWSGVSKYNQFILGPNGVNGKMAFLIYSGTWYPSNYGSSIWGQQNLDATQYHYYVGDYNQDTGILSLYIDGELEVSFNIGSRVLNNDLADFSIGKRDVSNHFLNHTGGFYLLYNRSLSAQEIKQNYHALKSRYT